MTKRVFCIGNGESRQSFDLRILRGHGKIYGCNALYRDFKADVLIAVDGGIMHEVYHSGYCDENETWLRDWVPLPGVTYRQVVYGDLSESEFEVAKKHIDSVNENPKQGRKNFVFHGSTLQGKVGIIKRYADKPEAHEIMRKEVNHTGINVSWVNPNDKAHCLRDLIRDDLKDRGWAAGASAGWVALAQNKDLEEFYLIGHDLRTNTSKVNNMYKGTKYYAQPEQAPIPFTNWVQQFKTLFKEYKKVKFYKVNPNGQRGNTPIDSRVEEWNDCPNVEYLTFQNIIDKFGKA